MLTRLRSWRTGRSITRLSIEPLEDRCLLAAAAAYTLTDLGTLGGGSTAFAYDINEAGQVVGYATTADLKYHAFLWTDGVMADLGTFPTGSLSKAFGVNNLGQAVGYAFDGSVAGGATNRGFLADGGPLINLSPAPEWSTGNAINSISVQK